MVRQYYVPQITKLSGQELQAVFEAAEPPVCLLGGWAVHLHVNPGFREKHGREYVGSRDIDVGVHIDPSWTPEELPEKPTGKSLTAIQNLGYTKSRFGFVQNFHRDTQEKMSEDRANEYRMHEVFQLYIDIIPDTTKLHSFREAFGFKPPAEPLLQPVFEEEKGEPLSNYVPWDAPNETAIVPGDLLAAMKIKSLPKRDKSHKKVKDIADLHSLLWYVEDYHKMKTKVQSHVSNSDLNQVKEATDEATFEKASQLLQTDQELITDSIQRLYT